MKFTALFLAWTLPAALAANSYTHSSLADFRSGSGDGQVDFTNASGGEVVLQKAMSSLGSFSNTASMPLPLHDFAMWANDEAVYVLGGNSLGAPQIKVYSATLGASGTLGSWQTLAPMSVSRAAASFTVWNSWIYYGGGDAGATTVYGAKILAGGGLGAWTVMGTQPVADSYPYVAAVNGNMIFAPGQGYQSAVYSAPIRGDGSLGIFTLQGPAARPLTLNSSCMADAAGGLFMFGGEDAGGIYDDVFSTTVGDDGSVAAWAAPTGAHLPSARSYLSGGRSCGYGRLFCLGGRSGFPTPYASNSVYAAALGGGAVLGAWGSQGTLPASLSAGNVFAGKGYLWYLGGVDTGIVSQGTIYTAAVSVGAANAPEGGYQNAFDLGADMALVSLSWSAVPAAHVSLQVRSAPNAGAAFGAWSAPSSSPPITLSGNARYVEYKATFSDPGSGSQAELDDVTLVANPLTTPTPTPTPTATPSSTPALACGSYVAQWPTSANPEDIAIDASGNVYVAEGASDDVKIYSSSGSFLGSWGSAGSGDGQFNVPIGIAIKGSTVYVVDGNGARVEYFNLSGTFLGKWGGPGSGNGQFNLPERLAIDAGGNVYVTDMNNNRVQKFSAGGTYLGQWGGLGSGNGQLNAPVGVGVGPNGNIYVADSNNARVQEFSPAGAYIAQWGSAGSGNGQFAAPYVIAIDGSGDLYVTDQGNYRVEAFDSSGNYLTQWGSQGTGNGQFTLLVGLAVDPSGFVYTGDWGGGANRVEKFGCVGAAATATPTPTPAKSQGIDPGLIGHGRARAYPNPARHGGGKENFACIMEEAGTARITVWNSAAQLAGSVDNHFVAGQAVLGLSLGRFAPGIYIYQIKFDYDSGRTVMGPVQHFAVQP